MTPELDAFVRKYKNISWDLPDIPKGLSPIELTKWLFNQDEIGWLKLDVDFDLNQWLAESQAAEKFYVTHRDWENYDGVKHNGWASCCIHGLSVDRTQADENIDLDKFHWTELADEVPSITNFWKKFPVERYKRLRFMKLDANGFIGIHNDLPPRMPAASLKELNVLENTISINVSITQPDGCDFVTKEFGTVPWNKGDSYIINITKDHCVVNQSDIPRIHIIAECVVGNRLNDFSELIYRSFKKQYGYN